MANDKSGISGISDNIYVVLSRTLHGGNIGSVARSMNNFGLSRLRLAAPICGINEDSRKMAMNSHHELDSAEIFPDFKSAIAGMDIVAGTTRRMGRGRSRFFSSVAFAPELIAAAETGKKIALVFGPEDAGLSNEETDLCDWLINIKTFSEFDSLNISHAVTVLLYEINRRFLTRTDTAVDSQYLEGLYTHLEETLREIEFLPADGRDPRRAMLGLRRMISRANWSKSEIELFHSFLNKIDNIRKSCDES